MDLVDIEFLLVPVLPAVDRVGFEFLLLLGKLVLVDKCLVPGQNHTGW